MKLQHDFRRLIIFIHGFGSDKDSTKYLALKEQLDPSRFVVEIIENDYTLATKHEIQEKLDQVINRYPTLGAILVGHSLGGYWARVLACENWLPAVLVNPSMKPWETLGNKIPVAEYKPVPQVSVDRLSGLTTEFVYIELGDEVVDQQSQINDGFFKESELTTVPCGHHRIEFLNNIITEVINLNVRMNRLESLIFSD